MGGVTFYDLLPLSGVWGGPVDSPAGLNAYQSIQHKKYIVS